MSHPVQFEIWSIVALVYVNEILWVLDPPWLFLESIPPSPGLSFYTKRGRKYKWDGGRCGSLSMSNFDLSRFSHRASFLG
jgi:hypothetical protein